MILSIIETHNLTGKITAHVGCRTSNKDPNRKENRSSSTKSLLNISLGQSATIIIYSKDTDPEQTSYSAR